ncbi:MAG: hypothetical protein HQK52_10450 [Oligoflexia bacterium]|nr:hypothetical protein [Oligoflexia bacterium]
MNLLHVFKSVNVSVTSLVLLAIVANVAVAGHWDEENNPSAIEQYTGQKLIYKLQQLPTSGRLENKPWPDTYWPTRNNGIAWDWSGEGSPAGKFDKAKGDGSGIAIKEWFRTRGIFARTAPDWAGICHGWAPAALNFEEPGTCDYNGVHFYSGDIKALLDLMQGNYNPLENCQVGGRSGTGVSERRVVNADEDNVINDINPGAFHLIIANSIGRYQQGFVMDKDGGGEVWNQPTEGFKVLKMVPKSVDRSLAAAGTVKEYEVETDVIYTDEEGPSKEPVVEKKGEADKEFRKHWSLKYILETDAQDNIIGGRWLQADHPDFIWFSKRAEFPEPFGKTLKAIYQKSLQNK